ncbi:MAG: DegV family protein [Gemmatimonadota bacterium]
MNPTVARVTDSTSEVHALGLSGSWAVVPLEIEIDGRRLREGPELSSTDFYALFQQANAIPVTIPPSPERFAAVYRRLLETHERLLSIHLSGELSRTVDHALEAADRIGASNRVLVIDSRLAGLPLGLLCLEAEARLAAGGEPAEVAKDIQAIARATRVYFSVYTLDFLYLSGRLDRSPSRGGSDQDDRPILALEDGRLSLIERVVGETTRVERMVDLVALDFEAGEPIVAACVHAGARGKEAAGQLEQALAEVRRPARWYRASLGPVLCAHTGFDVCGIATYPASLSALGR